MKELFWVGVLALSLTFFLLILRQWVVKTRKSEPPYHPAYLIRYEDGDWEFETEEVSIEAERRSVIRIKLPPQVMRYSATKRRSVRSQSNL